MAFTKMYVFAFVMMTIVANVCVAEDPASNLVDPPAPAVASSPQGQSVAAPSVEGQSPASPPVAANPGVISAPGVTGTVTQHKGEDGSILTISRFNGNIPANAFPSFPTVWGNPFMQFGGPGYGYPGAQFQGIRHGR